MAKKTFEEEREERGLSHPNTDVAGAKLRKAFRDAEEAVKLKMQKEFGEEFIQEFMSRMRQEVNRLPLNIDQQVQALISERLGAAFNAQVNSEVQAQMKQFWGDFIQKEVAQAINNPALIITLVKKIKEII